MIKKRHTLFLKLPNNNKVMLALRLTTKMRNIILNIFINAYTLSVHSDVSLLIVSNIVYFIFSHAGYAVNGLRLRNSNISLKNNFVISYVIFICSFIYLYFTKEQARGIMSFYALFGLGNGLYYFTTIYFESGNLPENMRDFYASTLKGLENIVKIIVPALISLIFIYAGSLENIGGYDIILPFATIPFILALALIVKLDVPPIQKMTESISKWRYFSPKINNTSAIAYYCLFGVQRDLSVLFSIFLMATLINEINIGFYESIISSVSIILLLLYSVKTNANNRDKWMGISFTIVGLAIMGLGFFQNAAYLVVYSIIMIFLFPIAGSIQFAYYYDILDSLKSHNNIQFDHQAIIWTDYRVNFARITFLLVIVAIIGIWGVKIGSIVGFVLLGLFQIITPYIINLTSSQNNG